MNVDELPAMNQGLMNPEDYSTVTWVPNFKKKRYVNIIIRTCNSRAGRVHLPGSRLSVFLGLKNSDQTVVLEVFHRIFIDPSLDAQIHQPLPVSGSHVVFHETT